MFWHIFKWFIYFSIFCDFCFVWEVKMEEYFKLTLLLLKNVENENIYYSLCVVL